MDNIDKTLILSYPRTGSTALLDVYRLYLENKYPDEYLNMPSEPMEADQFFNLNDYAGIRYPFHKFCEKHNLPKIEVINLLHYKETVNMRALGDSIFKSILTEKYFATKIFSSHVNIYPEYIKQVLEDHIQGGNNLICLYRRNFLDTISSIITCTWSKQWVIRSKENQTLITADEVDIKEDIEPIKRIVYGLKTWYDTYYYLSKKYNNIKLIAYEDIESFDSNLLLKLHNVDIDFKIEPRIKIQHDKEQQNKVIEKHQYLIDEVLTDEVMKTLPLNESYEVVL